MTCSVVIEHTGPKSYKVEIRQITANPNGISVEGKNPIVTLEAGEKFKEYIWKGKELLIREIEA